MLLALKEEEGATSQGMWVTSRSREQPLADSKEMEMGPVPHL